MGKKVKIFSISGDFLSGKSTLMNNMIEKMKDLGFIEDNIHKISSDKMFREYFDKVMKIFENINNDEILKQLSEDETIKDIFNNPEYRKKIESIYVKLNGINFNFSDYDITLANSMQELEEIRIKNEEEIRNLLNIPEKHGVLSVITIGYKDEEKEEYDEDKVEFSKVHYNKF